MISQFPAAVPEIPVSDIVAASDYYGRCLGFSLDWGDEKLGLAGISKGDCRLFLANAPYRKGYGNAGPALTWLNLESKGEVDELYRVWRGAGAELMSEPQSKPWGLYEFTAADPDGNYLRVFFDFKTPERADNVSRDDQN